MGWVRKKHCKIQVKVALEATKPARHASEVNFVLRLPHFWSPRTGVERRSKPAKRPKAEDAPRESAARRRRKPVKRPKIKDAPRENHPAAHFGALRRVRAQKTAGCDAPPRSA